MRKLLREPLLHFFVLGSLLFGSFAWLNPGAADTPDVIVVTRGQQQNLALQFARTRARPPTADEQQAMIENWIREEVLYREGQAMGLDRDDPVVRRRVAQKLEFIADNAELGLPTPTESQAWLDADPERYAIEARYTLQQVYFDPARHGDELQAEIAAARHALDAGNAFAGDSTMLPPALTNASTSEVRRDFGQAFVSALQALPLGAWQGPVSSAFGLHLVRLDDRIDARLPTLEEVRAEVERDLLDARATAARVARYEQLRERYSVRIEPMHATVTATP